MAISLRLPKDGAGGFFSNADQKALKVISNCSLGCLLFARGCSRLMIRAWLAVHSTELSIQFCPQSALGASLHEMFPTKVLENNWGFFFLYIWQQDDKAENPVSSFRM